MPIFSAVKNYLEAQAISFDITSIEIDINQDRRRWLRAVLCEDAKGRVVAVVPYDNFLDMEILRSQSQRPLRPVYGSPHAAPGEDATGVVPLGAFVGVPTLMDRAIPHDGNLYFAAGAHTLVRMEASAVHASQKEVSYLDISCEMTPDWIAQRREQLAFTRKRIESLLDEVQGLPAMPEMAQRILHVAGDTDSTAQDLAKAIEIDPSLSAQIISYATSAFYGYRGDISSVRDAITRVLGFELVANIAAGISLGTAFKIPAEGPIGLSAFWRHAVYTSALAERLCKALPRDRQARPGAAYMSGLLHDFGYLVLGHILPPVFDALNQAIAANPTINVTQVESLILGSSHTAIGARLLQRWKLPAETVITAQYHHTPDYRAEDAVYAHLIGLAESLLHEQGVANDADSIRSDISPALLGLDTHAIEKAAQPVLDACAELDTLSRMLGNQ